MTEAWTAIRAAMAAARQARRGLAPPAPVLAVLAALRARDDLPPAGLALLDLVERSALPSLLPATFWRGMLLTRGTLGWRGTGRA